MSSIRRAEKLAESGKVEEAYELLSSRAEKGDGEAAMLLAQWRMSGAVIRRDLGEARRLFGIAAEAGEELAEPAFIALLANGAGGIGRKWGEALSRLRARTDEASRAQADTLAAMELDAQGDPAQPPVAQQLLQSPRVWKFPSFLSESECRYLRAMAKPLLQPSVVVHPQTGQMIQDPVRRSTVAMFPFVEENPVIHAINRRIAAATSTTYEQGEPLQILSYRRGEEYRQHSDALPGEPNQRVLTFLVYLNDGYEGGETRFPSADFAFRGATGDGLLFANVDRSGQPDRAAVHAGCPVDKGRKMLLSKWIRGAPMNLAGPPGRPL